MRKRAAGVQLGKSDPGAGRPVGALQSGYRVLASIAEALHEEFGVSVVAASRAAAALGREVGWVGFGRNLEINEESIRQTVSLLRKRDRARNCYEGCWISVDRMIIEQAALKLPKLPQSVIDAISARKKDIEDVRQLAAARNLEFTPAEIQFMNARNEKRAREAPDQSKGVPFSRRRKK